MTKDLAETVVPWFTKFMTGQVQSGKGSASTAFHAGGAPGQPAQYFDFEHLEVGRNDRLTIAATLQGGRPVLVAKTFSGPAEAVGREQREWLASLGR